MGCGGMSNLPSKREIGKRYLRAANSYPELLLFPDDEASKKAMRRAMFGMLKSRSVWLWTLGVCAIPNLLISLIPKAFSVLKSMPAYIDGAIIGGVSGGLAVSVMFLVGRNKVRRSLRSQLQEMSIPVCLQCGYDLRGQNEPRCPECGLAFNPALLKRATCPQPPSEA